MELDMADTGPLTVPGGGAPAPDPERVSAIRAAITGDAEACAAFAEPALAALVSLNSHTLARTRDGDLGECMVLLGHVRDRVAALDPARLQPRGGLAGLFDSRSGRLKAFREAWSAAAAAATEVGADFAGRSGAIATRTTALDHLWTETRDAIATLDAHIAAARIWLADRAAPTPAPTPAPAPATIDAEPAAGDPHEPAQARADTEIEHAPVDLEAGDSSGSGSGALPPSDATPPDAVAPEPDVAALPHPLETRLTTITAVRAVALGRLPLLRAAQNADYRAPVVLKDVCDGIEAWRADWQNALGLGGRKPKRVRPDPDRLTAAQTTLADRLATGERELTAAQVRRAELEARAATPSSDRRAA